MVLPMKNFSPKNFRGEGDLAKNAVFDHFLCHPPLSKVRPHYSANLKARWLPHGSFEPLWAKVTSEHWKMAFLKKNWGPSSLWSQSLDYRSRIVSPPKAVFMVFFKIIFLTHCGPMMPPSVIHGCKAVDLIFLMLKRKKNSHPAERMIFYDAPHRYFPLYWEAVV